MKTIIIIDTGRRILQDLISRLIESDIDVTTINNDPIPTNTPDPFDTTPSYLITKIHLNTPFVEESSPIFQPKKHTKSNYASHKRKKRR